MPLNCRTGSEF